MRERGQHNWSHRCSTSGMRRVVGLVGIISILRAGRLNLGVHAAGSATRLRLRRTNHTRSAIGPAPRAALIAHWACIESVSPVQREEENTVECVQMRARAQACSETSLRGLDC